MHNINYLNIRSWQKVQKDEQFRPLIALRTDLSHITTELWEIRNVENGALNSHMII